MARAPKGPLSVRPRPTRAARKRLQRYKVVLESVIQEKKRLRSIISFEAKAPRGYTFIPAGNPRLTNACKEICRRDGAKVFAVSTTPHTKSHYLSQHVHRIGYHFPSSAVAQVCTDLSLYLTATGKAISLHGTDNNERLNLNSSEASQVTINTEARDVLRDLFPSIPDSDLNQIIKTSFQKGQRKVGTAVELPLQRRAQLAVVAHIRHAYTDYDRLLKAASFHEARSLVEEATLKKLVEWRGDDENGKMVLEDVFREVIVIPDDDDDGDSDDNVGCEANSTTVDRKHSVEVISSSPAYEDLETKPLDLNNLSLHDHPRELSDDDVPSGFYFVPNIPRVNKSDRRGFSRYQAWERATNRYRGVAAERGLKEPHVRRIGFQQPSQLCSDDDGIPEPTGFNIISPHRIHAVPHTNSGSRNTGNVPSKILSSNPIAERRLSDRKTSVVVPGEARSHPRTQQTFNPILTLSEPYGLQFQAESRKRTKDIIHPSNSPAEQMQASQREIPLRMQDAVATDASVFVNSVSSSFDSYQRQKRHPGARIAYHSGIRLNSQDCALPSIEKPQPLPLRPRYPTPGRVNHPTERALRVFGTCSGISGRLPGSDIPYQGGQANCVLAVPIVHQAAQQEIIRREPVPYSGYETIGLISPASPRCNETNGTIISDVQAPTERWPALGGFYTDSKYSRPDDFVEHQQRRFRESRPDCKHSDSRFITPIPWAQRQVDHTDTYFPQHLRNRSDARLKGAAPVYRSSSAGYKFMDRGSNDCSALIPSGGARSCRGHNERHDLHISGRNMPTISASQAPTEWVLAGDYLHAPIQIHGREQLYAEGFVRSVGLSDLSAVDPAPRGHKGNMRELYGQAEGELSDSTVSAVRSTWPAYGSGAVYPDYYNWIDTAQSAAHNSDRLISGRPKR